MTVTVAVVDHVPAYRESVAAVLARAGYVVREPRDVVRWASRHDDPVVVLADDHPEAASIGEGLRQHAPGAALLTVARSDRAPTSDDPLDHSVVEATADAETLLAVLQATCAGHVVVPRRWAARLRVARPSGLDEIDHELLRTLATGATVAEVGAALGWSQRTAYRRMQDLYRRMGARNRLEAVAMLTPPPPPPPPPRQPAPALAVAAE